jgi:small-conductance mechanosensitive channel
MTDTGLKFELVCFVSDVEASSRTKSDLHFEIFRRFKAAGLEILTGGPPAPTRITIEGLHEIIERTSR